MPEYLRSTVTVPLYKSKGERTEYSKYRGVSLLSVVRKIYVGILEEKINKMTRDLIDDEQGRFKAWRGHVNQITLKQIGEKPRKKKYRVYVDFMDMEKINNRVNSEVLWQVLRMYDVGGKLMNIIKNIYVNSLAYVKVKGVRVSDFSEKKK